ncbi:MAG: tryptophan 7-halogenase, partial [Myxococcales bacterium]|nr:tryptophan 7-halogenase [Myxococcales bacterium]
GGPGGSTAGALLRTYDPALRVIILEREVFPRDHVGESQLPPIGAILEEMGCWDAVEGAGFPIKVGATYRWGRDSELWDFEFVPSFRDEPRPAPYAGQRKLTAFQVDRARYDQILLQRAAALGCEVREGTAVAAIERDGDQVLGLGLRDGGRIRAREYIDASGHHGVLRRAMGVEVECPTRLKNIAIWDYWENAAWAVEIGVGGTRVQVLSVGFGWIWFIPLGPTRTSIGLICPVEHYRSAGRSAEALYLEAIAQDDRVSALVRGATRRGQTETTSDWSFLAERSVGANWMLVGESAGFADPILAAGLTLTHVSAREAAYSILEARRGGDRAWLLGHFDLNQRRRIRQHIRFADFWYAANGLFTELQDHCQAIAADAGLKLSSAEAWAWLARGGFTNDAIGQAGIGGLDLAGMKQVAQRFTKQPARWRVSESNIYELALDGAAREELPLYREGRVQRVVALTRGEARLALTGMYKVIVDLLARGPVDAQGLVTTLQRAFARQGPQQAALLVQHALQALEVMLSEGWVRGRNDPRRGRISLETPDEGPRIHANRDVLPT